MSATKNWLHDYQGALDAAWEAMEEAIVKLNELNDQIYNPDGDLVARVPGADARLMAEKIRELKTQVDCFANARQWVSAKPTYLPPITPAESPTFRVTLRDCERSQGPIHDQLINQESIHASSIRPHP